MTIYKMSSMTNDQDQFNLLRKINNLKKNTKTTCN